MFAADLVRRSITTRIYLTRTDHMVGDFESAGSQQLQQSSFSNRINLRPKHRVYYLQTNTFPQRGAGCAFKVHWSRRSRIFSLFDHSCRTQSFMNWDNNFSSCKCFYSAYQHSIAPSPECFVSISTAGPMDPSRPSGTSCIQRVCV